MPNKHCCIPCREGTSCATKHHSKRRSSQPDTPNMGIPWVPFVHTYSPPPSPPDPRYPSHSPPDVTMPPEDAVGWSDDPTLWIPPDEDDPRDLVGSWAWPHKKAPNPTQVRPLSMVEQHVAATMANTPTPASFGIVRFSACPNMLLGACSQAWRHSQLHKWSVLHNSSHIVGDSLRYLQLVYESPSAKLAAYLQSQDRKWAARNYPHRRPQSTGPRAITRLLAWWFKTSRLAHLSTPKPKALPCDASGNRTS